VILRIHTDLGVFYYAPRCFSVQVCRASAGKDWVKKLRTRHSSLLPAAHASVPLQKSVEMLGSGNWTSRCIPAATSRTGSAPQVGTQWGPRGEQSPKEDLVSGLGLFILERNSRRSLGCDGSL